VGHVEVVAPETRALLLAFLDEAPLGVEGGVLAEDPGIGVAHEVEDHIEGLAGTPTKSERLPGIRF
jgi:hypothetical protein